MPEGDNNNVSVASDLEVLVAEYRRFWPDKPAPATLEDYYKAVKENGQAALCLSGGGIRSASFGLGVAQALSRAGLLTRFHYLSTVSGGGYTGSLLQRWIHEQERDAEKVRVALARPEEPEELKRLRQNSNFITPKVGLRSNDTWTAVAISVRNILLNWLLFIPLIMLVALAPNLFFDSVNSIRDIAVEQEYVLLVPLILAALAIAIATFWTVRLLPSYRSPGLALPDQGDPVLRRRIVHPLIVWAVVATLALACELLGPNWGGKATKLIPTYLLVGPGLDLALFSLGGMIIGLFFGALTLEPDRSHTFTCNIAIWPISFLLVAGWIAFGGYLFNELISAQIAENVLQQAAATLPEQAPRNWAPIVLTLAGPLWLLTGTLLGAIFFVGFRSAGGPTVVPDDDREWIARLSAIKLKQMLIWAVIAPAVLLITTLTDGVAQGDDLSWSGGISVIAGLVAVLGGRSDGSGGAAGSARRIMLRFLPINAIIAIATLIFIVGLLIVFGLVEALLAGEVAGLFTKLPEWLDARVLAHFVILGLLLVLLALLGRKISVNRFSLNGLYRNRLARAFLGAARPPETRKKDPFTGFDAADNVRMSLLDPRASGNAVLYPVINVALNVTATENLAWQERKAEPFVFTPLYCGSGMLGADRAGAYVDSAIYAAGEHDAGMGPDRGVSLATAMSLSGAAAAPNMGYYSSAGTAFLMTLFNVRLGAWLPNPARAGDLGREGVERASPRNSVGAILRELRGETHDRGLDIYLSDGGHFENLALYEMVRRRCKYLLVSDAGADPACALKDLGNAVRKVKIDFNVDIDFPKLRLAGRDTPLDEDRKQTAWALGTVRYPEGGEGRILYLKPSFFGENLPADVIAYARGCATFPHETTADQFFSESQFESYRRLGDHFLNQLLVAMAVIRNQAGAAGIATMAEFFDAVAEIDDDPEKLKPVNWRAPPPSPARPRRRRTRAGDD